MAEYIDIDEEVVFVDVRGREVTSTVRDVLVRNKAKYKSADVRPIVPGYWYWDKDGMDWGLGAWRCSVCHGRNANVFGPETHPPMRCAGSKWCPNCGAKMGVKNG